MTSKHSDVTCVFPSRDDTDGVLEEGVRRFEGWCRLLLLDAVQRAGYFRAGGQRAATADIVRLNRRAAGAAGHARMVEAALDILLAAGLIRHGLSHLDIFCRIKIGRE